MQYNGDGDGQRDIEMKHKFTDNFWNKFFEFEISNQTRKYFPLLHAATVSLCFLLLCF